LEHILVQLKEEIRPYNPGNQHYTVGILAGQLPCSQDQGNTEVVIKTKVSFY
jgi:hypothetical protein